MTDINDILAKLDKKTRDRVLLAKDTEIIRHPYYSLGLTRLTGGWAEGRIHLFYGPKSAGKSMILMQTAGQQQALGKSVALIDAEGSYDKEFGARLGVDNDNLIINGAKSFAKAQEAGVDLIKAGVDILIIDSISNLIPEAFLEENGDTKAAENQKQIGVKSKSTGVLLNSLHYNNKHTAIFIISQVRMQAGAQHFSQGYEGGKAMEHAASQIIKLSASSAEKQQKTMKLDINGRLVEKPVARDVSIFVEKNKLGPASGTSEYRMYYDGPFLGIDTFQETVKIGVETGVIAKGGAWLKYDGQSWQGEANMAESFKSDLDLFEKVQKEVLAIEES